MMRFVSLTALPYRYKLLLLCLTISTATILATLVIISLWQTSEFKHSLRQTTEMSGKIVANNLTAPLAFNDAKEAAKVIQSLQVNENVRIACLYDKSSGLFAHYPDKPASIACPAVFGAAGAYGLWLTITQKGDTLGTLYIASNEPPVGRFLLAQALPLLACLALITLLIAYPFAHYIQSILGKPVQGIIGKVNQMVDSMPRTELLTRGDELYLTAQNLDRLVHIFESARMENINLRGKVNYLAAASHGLLDNQRIMLEHYERKTTAELLGASAQNVRDMTKDNALALIKTLTTAITESQENLELYANIRYLESKALNTQNLLLNDIGHLVVDLFSAQLNLETHHIFHEHISPRNGARIECIQEVLEVVFDNIAQLVVQIASKPGLFYDVKTLFTFGIASHCTFECHIWPKTFGSNDNHSVIDSVFDFEHQEIERQMYVIKSLCNMLNSSAKDAFSLSLTNNSLSLFLTLPVSYQGQ